MLRKSLVLLSTLLLSSFVAFGQDQSKPAQNTAPPAQSSTPPAQAAAPAAQAPAPAAQAPAPNAQAAPPNAQNGAPAHSKIPDEALKLANPVKPTAESIASGKRMYGYDCAMCHGDAGDGKGDLAGDMKLQLADFRDTKSLHGKTDGELFYVIKNGKGQMPAEGTRAKPDQIWNMVNYIRSLTKAGNPGKTETPAKTESSKGK